MRRFDGDLWFSLLVAGLGKPRIAPCGVEWRRAPLLNEARDRVEDCFGAVLDVRAYRHSSGDVIPLVCGTAWAERGGREVVVIGQIDGDTNLGEDARGWVVLMDTGAESAPVAWRREVDRSGDHDHWVVVDGDQVVHIYLDGAVLIGRVADEELRYLRHGESDPHRAEDSVRDRLRAWRLRRKYRIEF